MHVHVHAHVHVHVHAHVHADAHVHLHVHAHAHVHVQVHIHVHAHVLPTKGATLGIILGVLLDNIFQAAGKLRGAKLQNKKPQKTILAAHKTGGTRMYCCALVLLMSCFVVPPCTFKKYRPKKQSILTRHAAGAVADRKSPSAG